MDFFTSPVFWGPVVAVIVLIAVIRIFIRNYIKVPPNQVAVFTGRGRPKIVRGGARLKIPGLERVDTMSLEPFDVNISLRNSLTSDGVPVNIEAVGLAKIGSTDEAVNTAIQRFLTSQRDIMSAQINEIFAGGLRGIVATMTVEDLNSSRDKLATGVIEEVGADLEKIGLEVDTLKIQTISDDNGYLIALGQKRTAEVKRDAEIGTAEAERDARIKSAQARQAGAVAEAESDAAIAAANKERDVKIAKLRAETESENARANQAGPLAEAEAMKDVGVAREAAEAARVEARVIVEQKRALEAEAQLQADVVARAEAEKTAAIAQAEGLRKAAILQAEAEAESARQAGNGSADARKAEAEAARIEMEAQAAGLRAQLLAEADGKAKIAEALNAYSGTAAQLLTLPDVLEAFVKATAESAKQVGAIKDVSIIGGAGGADQSLGAVLGMAPQNIAGVIKALELSGIDVSGILNAVSGNRPTGKRVPAHAAAPPAADPAAPAAADPAAPAGSAGANRPTAPPKPNE